MPWVEQRHTMIAITVTGDLAVIIIAAAIMSIFPFKYAMVLLGFNEIIWRRIDRERHTRGEARGRAPNDD